MNATIIHSASTKKAFTRKLSFPILTIALWALLLYAGIRIVWNNSGPQIPKSANKAQVDFTK